MINYQQLFSSVIVEKLKQEVNERTFLWSSANEKFTNLIKYLSIFSFSTINNFFPFKSEIIFIISHSLELN